MSPYFFTYKSIGITWFMVLAILGGTIGYFIAKLIGKEHNIGKKHIEDISFALIIAGFVGARLFYVLLNFNLYKDNLFHIFRISHMNLSLIGGIIASLAVIYWYSRRLKIPFGDLVSTYSIPFYFSMAIGVWSLFFEGSLIGKQYEGALAMYYMGSYRHPLVIYLSLLFIFGILMETLRLIKTKNKNYSYIFLIIIMAAYYIVKMTFIP